MSPAPSRLAAPAGSLERPIPRVERPKYLVVLAASFVVATFLDGVNLLAIPWAENPANVVGVMLALAFVIGRLPGAKLWTGPARYFWAFIATSALLEMVGFLADPSGGTGSLRVYAMYVQVFVVYVIFYDLCRSPYALRVLAVTSISSCILMSLVANLGLDSLVGSSQIQRGLEAERVGVLGMNLNVQAFLYASGITGVFCWSIGRWPRLSAYDWVFVGGAASMALALLRTGSRGGVLTLAASIGVALVLMFRGRRWTAYLVLVPVALWGLAIAVMQSEATLTRFGQAVYEGRLGSRDILLQEGWVMFTERFVAGWGCQYTEDLGLRVGRDRIAAHNTYLQIALSFGLLGFLPWFAGIGATMLRLWKHRKQFAPVVMLAVMAALLIAAIPGNLSYGKYTWMILAAAGAMPLGVPLARVRMRAGAVGAPRPTNRPQSMPASRARPGPP